MDIDTGKLKKNAFRVSKVRGVGAARIRIPGGNLTADTLGKIQEIAQRYGNGIIHLTSRQGFEIEGVRFEDMDAVNRMLQPVIDALGINQTTPQNGYPASGTRNIASCIGNDVCPFANYNTVAFAKRMERAIYPNDLHVKIAFTGCPNDCAKARMQDFGIIGMTEPQYDPQRCVTCQACVKGCKSLSVGALHVENNQIVRNTEKCVGCGVCVTKCPMRALTRSKETYYKLVIFGRTGKSDVRLAQDFLLWVSEDVIMQVVQNTYRFVETYIRKDAPGGKEHIGYIVDRVGFAEFKRWALEGVELGEKAIVKEPIYWSGIRYK